MGKLGSGTMQIVEVTYQIAERSEPQKVRMVVSNSLWAIGEIYKRRYKGTGKQILSIEDQGSVNIAEFPKKDLLPELIAQTNRLRELL